ncbi:MAG: hypothetical protein IJN40_06275 [Clostridia bacterium]|nr:hypothetical protein [Clostridia bacterium]
MKNDDEMLIKKQYLKFVISPFLKITPKPFLASARDVMYFATSSAMSF